MGEICIMAALSTWCDFCYASQERGDIGNTPAFIRHCKAFPSSRVIFESKNFVALAGLGQITSGYVLLLSKEHYPSMSHLPTFSDYVELEQVSHYLISLLAHYYVRPIVFEHGPMPACDKKHECAGGGSCMDHAHLHFFPVPTGTDSILHHLQGEHAHYRIDGFQDMGKQSQRNMPYLFFESISGQRWLFDAPTVPSQYLRRFVAQAVGQPELWNWQLYPQQERLRETVEILRDAAVRR
jgi:ATP adenylyltransferase